MLEPDNRRLLMDSLAPPQSYEFDRAVATTFTLDLTTLLAVPLAFTFDRAEDQEGLMATDPLALLECARRHAERIAVFCHGGYVSTPRPGQTALAFLENSVISAFPPADGSGATFHPKVWLLRYVAKDGPVRYRLVCTSRNLTFDRSWDASLILDGEITKAANGGVRLNQPLTEFAAALTDLAVGPVPDFHRQSIDLFAAELPRVSFQAPPGLELCRFLAFGLGTANPIFPGLENRPLLVISPFVDGWFLNRLARRRPRTVLISRREELLRIEPNLLQGIDEVYEFRSSLDPEPEDLDIALPPLTGLHAKVYVIDDGWDARVCIGSANSTRAATGNPPRNVEFMVELSGKKARFGMDALLAKRPVDSGFANFRDLITTFVPDGPIPETDGDNSLERALDEAAEIVARADLSASVEGTEDGAFTLRIQVQCPLKFDRWIKWVKCRPATLHPNRADYLEDGVKFEDLRLEDVSGFLSVEVSADCGGGDKFRRFARPIPVAGMPADRLQRLIAGTLENRQRLMQLLWLLLTPDGEVNYGDFTGIRGGAEHPAQVWGTAFSGLLEGALETLADRPERLDHVDRLLRELRSTEFGAGLVGDDFADAWESVMTVRKQLA
ncbi:MAG: hypothetical protein F4X41_05380 [Chloroflexi bacterium]|nr:hypothetical protein [Chloroflexota bacterium]